VSATTNNCENNLSKPSVGVYGDNVGLGGGRWDIVRICATEGFSCEIRDGYVMVAGNNVDSMTAARQLCWKIYSVSMARLS